MYYNVGLQIRRATVNSRSHLIFGCVGFTEGGAARGSGLSGEPRYNS